MAARNQQPLGGTRTAAPKFAQFKLVLLGVFHDLVR